MLLNAAHFLTVDFVEGGTSCSLLAWVQKTWIQISNSLHYVRGTHGHTFANCHLATTRTCAGRHFLEIWHIERGAVWNRKLWEQIAFVLQLISFKSQDVSAHLSYTSYLKCRQSVAGASLRYCRRRTYSKPCPSLAAASPVSCWSRRNLAEASLSHRNSLAKAAPKSLQSGQVIGGPNAPSISGCMMFKRYWGLQDHRFPPTRLLEYIHWPTM